MKSENFQSAGDPWNYNCVNAILVTSSKFTYLENLYVYDRVFEHVKYIDIYLFEP